MKAIYAFSGDPITYGHIDIIERASKIFDELTIGIGVNPDKKYTFSLEERLMMARESLKHLNVDVVAFEGQLVDFAYEHNIGVIVRGIRNDADLDYEYTFYNAGMSQNLGIETIPIFAKPEFSHISSSIAKAIAKEQGRLETLVPPCVKRKLEEKILGQFILSVTGTIGVGKSYVTEKFIELGKKKDIEVHNIDLDVVTHDILSTLKEPMYVEIRNKLAERFGDKVRLDDGSINRKVLGEAVFNNREDLEFLNELMDPAINERMRREMYGKNGLILINAALLIESGYLPISNNNVLLVTVSSDMQAKRLKERGYTDSQIESRIKSQYDSKEKEELAKKIISDANYGTLWTLDTTMQEENDIEFIFNKIIESMNIISNNGNN